MDPREHRHHGGLRMAVDILEEDRPAEERADEQRAGGEHLRRRLADPAPAQPRDDRGDEWQEDDQDQRMHQPLILSAASTAMVPRRRKKMTRMARPIAASAAATVRTNIAITCPVRSPRKALNATRLMFTASRISSIAISIRMTLRRLRKIPSTPRTNRIAATVR